MLRNPDTNSINKYSQRHIGMTVQWGLTNSSGTVSKNAPTMIGHRDDTYFDQLDFINISIPNGQTHDNYHIPKEYQKEVFKRFINPGEYISFNYVLYSGWLTRWSGQSGARQMLAWEKSQSIYNLAVGISGDKITIFNDAIPSTSSINFGGLFRIEVVVAEKKVLEITLYQSVLNNNIKPPYNINKVVNIYHISPQTKGGDNMLRKVRLSKKPFQDDVQFADDTFNEFLINTSNNLNIQNESKGEYLFPYGYIRNNNGYSLFNIGTRFNNANFTFIRLGRNTVRVVMSYCIKLDKTISNTISYSNPFGTTAYDDMISIHIHFRGFLYHYPDKAKQIGLTTADYMKITNASGSGYICINPTTGEDMPDLFLARTSLYTTRDGVVLSSHERYITNPSSGSMWTGRTTFSIEYINFSYDVIMTLDDNSFTQESLDWFDMTEKKRNLINILNISPLNYIKYKEVS